MSEKARSASLSLSVTHTCFPCFLQVIVWSYIGSNRKQLRQTLLLVGIVNSVLQQTICWPWWPNNWRLRPRLKGYGLQPLSIIPPRELFGSVTFIKVNTVTWKAITQTKSCISLCRAEAYRTVLGLGKGGPSYFQCHGYHLVITPIDVMLVWHMICFPTSRGCFFNLPVRLLFSWQPQ